MTSKQPQRKPPPWNARKLTLPVEIDLHEPTFDEQRNATRIPMFFLIAHATLTVGDGADAKELSVGSDGGTLIIYLSGRDEDDHRAITVDARQLYKAFADYEKGEQNNAN